MYINTAIARPTNNTFTSRWVRINESFLNPAMTNITWHPSCSNYGWKIWFTSSNSLESNITVLSIRETCDLIGREDVNFHTVIDMDILFVFTVPEIYPSSGGL